MKKQTPVNPSEVQKEDSARALYIKEILLAIFLIVLFLGGYFMYEKFFAYDSTSYEASYSLSENWQYRNYSSDSYDQLLGKKPFALFFHANWCSSCRSQEKIIQQNLASLPVDFTILRVNFDTETELKKKYSVAMQSIVIVFDETGKEVGRMWDFSSIQKFIDLLSKK